eukprot:scaffold2487_cov98-Skeletonema_dohrnii-CCMP3373.AAC.3
MAWVQTCGGNVYVLQSNPAPIFGLAAGTPWLVASGGGRHRFRATGKDRAQFPGRNLGVGLYVAMGISTLFEWKPTTDNYININPFILFAYLFTPSSEKD